MQTTKYFRPEEFTCKCGCGQNKMQDSTLRKLDEAREHAGIPFRITSGYRCPAHNATVSHVPDSAHTTGHAADIKVASGMERYKVIKACLEAGFTRIGWAESFVHVDDDPSKPANVMWDY